MNNNPTPKSRFLAQPENIIEHRKLLDTPAFQTAIAVAQQAYTRALCDIAPGNMLEANYQAASAACFNRLQGMSDFCALLLNLSETPQPPGRKPTDNLDQKAN